MQPTVYVRRIHTYRVYNRVDVEIRLFQLVRRSQIEFVSTLQTPWIRMFSDEKVKIPQKSDGMFDRDLVQLNWLFQRTKRLRSKIQINQI